MQALARILVSAGLQALDLSPAHTEGTGARGANAGGPTPDTGNAASQQPVHERWRMYRGSATGVGLQLLNALAAAEAAEDAPLPPVAPRDASGNASGGASGNASGNASSSNKQMMMTPPPSPSQVMPPLHYVCRMGWTEWCAHPSEVGSNGCCWRMLR